MSLVTRVCQVPISHQLATIILSLKNTVFQWPPEIVEMKFAAEKELLLVTKLSADSKVWIPFGLRRPRLMRWKTSNPQALNRYINLSPLD
tara:strand:+ start:1076 stop:1345 length:270 start_codon:yes stop_codon:yes gene_type:complete